DGGVCTARCAGALGVGFLGGWSVRTASPASPSYGGWDSTRWMFLLMCNFFAVLWLSIGGEGRRELSPAPIAVLVLATLMLARVTITYFEGFRPRGIAAKTFNTFVEQITAGSMF